MSMYTATAPQMIRMLEAMAGWFGKAEAHAEQRGFPVDRLLQCRLAPDQYPLVRQVQIACDTAKMTVGRMIDQEPPAFPDDEQTFAELRERIAATVRWLQDLEEADFAGARERRIRRDYFPPGMCVRGEAYLDEFGLPNFYFHLTTAYAILRHNGVDLGKRDFIAGMSFEALPM